MNKWLLMVGALLLTACSSGVENKSYYQLPLAAQNGVQSTASQGNRLLWVEQVACRIIWQATAWSTRPAT